MATKKTKKKVAKKKVAKKNNVVFVASEELKGAAYKALREIKAHRELVPEDQSEHLTRAHNVLRDALRQEDEA